MVMVIGKKKKASKVVCLVVKGAVRKIIKDAGLRTGGDFVEALSEKVRNLIDAAVQSTKENGKKMTLGAEDIQQ